MWILTAKMAGWCAIAPAHSMSPKTSESLAVTAREAVQQGNAVLEMMVCSIMMIAERIGMLFG